MEPPILAALSVPDTSQGLAAARQLLRVADGRRLVFARAAIARIVNDPAEQQYNINDVRQLLAQIPEK